MMQNKLYSDEWDKIFIKNISYQGTIIDTELTYFIKLAQKKNIRKIIDVGCGCGRHTIYLARNGFKVIAVDISKVALKILRRRIESLDMLNSVKIIRCPISEIKNIKSKGIVCTGVLHHEKKINVIKNIKKIIAMLEPNGILYVTIPSKNDVRFLGGEKKSSNVVYPVNGPEKMIPHFFFDEKDIKRLFRPLQLIYLKERKRYFSNENFVDYCAIFEKVEKTY